MILKVVIIFFHSTIEVEERERIGYGGGGEGEGVCGLESRGMGRREGRGKGWEGREEKGEGREAGEGEGFITTLSSVRWVAIGARGVD